MVNCHILLVSLSGQGHVNPSLQFAKRLLQMGAKVTFSTSLSAIGRMSETGSGIPGLTLAPFSDGRDDGWTGAKDSKISCSLLELAVKWQIGFRSHPRFFGINRLLTAIGA
ncbi:crocetin glucosyltransferase, chloroplastic-like [Olea europaea subsp. europaea]|uniref:Crocetin glucosyltransferase, chloroplastic-like n=1 Tax=Olea europaea subsp. europaea TaxID=158383 RepID=A0A8S0TQ12_OLEEU|nr:crocetin glucosyltransferase, chloroplastic-like [Olea europaea subsp. europaea]